MSTVRYTLVAAAVRIGPSPGWGITEHCSFSKKRVRGTLYKVMRARVVAGKGRYKLSTLMMELFFRLLIIRPVSLLRCFTMFGWSDNECIKLALLPKSTVDCLLQDELGLILQSWLLASVALHAIRGEAT